MIDWASIQTWIADGGWVVVVIAVIALLATFVSSQES